MARPIYGRSRLLIRLALLAAVSIFSGLGGKTFADESAAKSRIPVVDDALPELEALDEQGNFWKSTGRAGKGPLVIYFYPGDFTRGSIKQVEAYREGLAKLEEVGVELVGVSGDEAATHKNFKGTYGLKHTLLADPDGKLGKLVGVPVSAGGRVSPTTPDRKPITDANGKRIIFLRPVTIACWTLVVDKDEERAPRCGTSSIP